MYDVDFIFSLFTGYFVWYDGCVEVCEDFVMLVFAMFSGNSPNALGQLVIHVLL